MNKIGRSLIICFLIAVIAGCTAIGKQLIEQPKVALDRVNVKDVGASGATVVFAVQVDNPNGFPLKVDALRYDVEIAGKPLSSGRIEQAAVVGANQKSIVEIPVPVLYTDVFSSLTSLFGSGTSQYRIKGEATFGLFTVPFDQNGEFKLKK